VQSENNLQHIVRFMLGAFLLTALALVFWTVIRADAILARPDNPRAVDAVLEIERGAILDRTGIVLAETNGPTSDQRRYYPYPAIGPAVGYYSFRHGTDGVESSFDALLRGDSEDFWQTFMRQALHEPQTGQSIQLTLDAGSQLQAEKLMADHKGALVLFQETGEASDIVALVSHPGYDPNQLRESFPELVADEEAPLLNRVTKGQYQPGLVLQPFILAHAVEDGLLQLDAPVAHPNRPILVNSSATYCANPAPESASWQDTLHHRCPGPMLDLVETLSLTDFDNAFARFNLTAQPTLSLSTETVTYLPLAEAAQAAIGQDNLIVTPLQVANAWLALNQNGRFPTLRLVSHIENELGDWVPLPSETNGGETAVSPQTAAAILQALPQTDDIREFSTLVISGPEGTTNTWYLGAAPGGETVVIVLEDTADLALAEEMGRALLNR
jgi:penicillin-binding protein A